MGLESATDISGLNTSWPLGSDERSTTDDHIRLLKTVIKALAAFPGGLEVLGFPASVAGEAGKFLKVNAGETAFDLGVLTDLGLPAQTGNAGKILGTNGSEMAWNSLPPNKFRCKVKGSVAQSLPNNAVPMTPINLPTEDFDIGGMHDPGDPSKITIPAGGDGLYLVVAEGSFALNGTGGRLVTVTLNDSENISAKSSPACVDETSHLQLFCVTSLAAGDFLRLLMKQYSGESLNTVPDGCRLTVVQIG